MGSRMPRVILGVAALTAAAVVAAGCGGGAGGGSSSSSTPGAGAPAPGGGLTVGKALASTSEEPLLVRGALIAPDGGEVRLCELVLESYPPQCGGASLVVRGVDLSQLDGLTHTNDPSLAQVTWSEGEISLLGTVRDGVLTVSQTSTASG
jgi:hypothetical protein